MNAALMSLELHERGIHVVCAGRASGVAGREIGEGSGGVRGAEQRGFGGPEQRGFGEPGQRGFGEPGSGGSGSRAAGGGHRSRAGRDAAAGGSRRCGWRP
jgi:uncharacterized protein